MTKITYESELHKELCIIAKDKIYQNYREFYGRKKGHHQFQMWSAVTCLETLRVGVDRSFDMLEELETLRFDMLEETEIEQEEG